MSTYPNSWRSVNLFDICQPRQWKTISTKELLPTGYSVYGANGTIGFYHSYTHEYPTLMITCRGAGCGNLHISEPFSYINGNAMALDNVNDSVCRQDFLYCYLRSRGFKDVISGSAQPQITQEGLRKVEIPLAPLPEQKRIADKVDRVLARVDACRNRLDSLPTLLKRFRQSVLAAATSGRLTEDWRTGNTGDNWNTVSLGQVATGFSYGSAAKSEKAGIVPVLRMGNIQNGQLDWNDLVYTSDHEEIEKYRLEDGDVLFNRTNSPELVGKTAVFNGERQAIYAGYLIRVRCSPDLLPHYLNYCLGSPAGRDYCWQVKSDGVSQSNINAKKLAAFEFQLPPLQEQHEIVRRVETLFAFADRLEARLNAARGQVERLTPALLAKAFRGELVPQDPADEPAAELLKRLAAQRAAEPAGGKRRQRSAGS